MISLINLIKTTNNEVTNGSLQKFPSSLFHTLEFKSRHRRNTLQNKHFLSSAAALFIVSPHFIMITPKFTVHEVELPCRVATQCVDKINFIKDKILKVGRRDLQSRPNLQVNLIYYFINLLFPDRRTGK